MIAPLLAERAPARPGPQTFAAEKDRTRLSEVAVKAFLDLARAWGLATPRPRR